MTDPLEPAFRALADRNRRLLLDRLFERDGQTLTELTRHLPEMTRFGVMRHLGVLEESGLINTRKFGREKRHYLNPVPIRLIHDRWISKYAAGVVGAMTAMKDHLEGPPMSAPDHVYCVYIKASPERIWQAITDGNDTAQYYYGTRVASDWTPGAPLVYTYPDGRVAADGDVIEVDPPNRLTMTFHPRWDPQIEAEGPVRMIWEVERAGPSMTKLTVTTTGMGPKTAEAFSGGTAFIVSALKTYLETGEALAAAG